MVEGGLFDENCFNISLDLLEDDLDLVWERLEEELELWGCKDVLEWFELDLDNDMELMEEVDVSLDLIEGGVLGGDVDGYKVEWYNAGMILVPAKNTPIL